MDKIPLLKHSKLQLMMLIELQLISFLPLIQLLKTLLHPQSLEYCHRLIQILPTPLVLLSCNSGDAQDDDNGSFTISGTSLILNSSPDYETKASYNIYINVNDGANNYAKAFTVSVTNINEAPDGSFV